MGKEINENDRVSWEARAKLYQATMYMSLQNKNKQTNTKRAK